VATAADQAPTPAVGRQNAGESSQQSGGELIRHYIDHAEAYATGTRNVPMTALCECFLAHVAKPGWVLDAGCGSGRDALAFLQAGHHVVAFDASPEMARLASQHTGLDVHVLDFLSLAGTAQMGLPAGTLFDGIWACASLLHVAEADQPEAWTRLWRLLAPGGVAYASYKLGEGERVDALGRPFTDATEHRLAGWTAHLPGVTHLRTWVSTDQRPGESQAWLNALVQRES